MTLAFSNMVLWVEFFEQSRRELIFADSPGNQCRQKETVRNHDQSLLRLLSRKTQRLIGAADNVAIVLAILNVLIVAVK